jgi:hypothetical protein
MDRTTDDDDDLLPTPNNDFDAVIDAGQVHLVALARAKQAIAELQGTVVEAGKNADAIKWVVVNEVTEDAFADVPSKTPQFRFSSRSNDGFGCQGMLISEIFEDLLPGGREETLERLEYLNKKLEFVINPVRKANHTRTIKLISHGEFLTFLGIMLGAIQCSVKGVDLWMKSSDDLRKTLSDMPDFGKYMSLWRFKEIRSVIPKMMQSETAKDNGDDWWEFTTYVSSFNRTRTEIVFLDGSTMVLDESMSAFVPRYVYNLIVVFFIFILYLNYNIITPCLVLTCFLIFIVAQPQLAPFQTFHSFLGNLSLWGQSLKTLFVLRVGSCCGWKYKKARYA